MANTTTTLTIDQTDELIRNAAPAQYGAIEDCEETDTAVAYFFENDMMGTVCRTTGAVTFTSVEADGYAQNDAEMGEL